MYQRRDFYRHARYVHGWLSAFAFIVLIFFALTGLFLNNSNWFQPSEQENTTSMTLPASVLSKVRHQENPSTEILAVIRQQQHLIGHFQSSERLDDTEMMIRLESPAGSTDIDVMLDTGKVEISQKPASVVSMLDDLHRGKNVPQTWKLLIDISAILILGLSIAGYILFLTLKTRLLSHLVLTAISLSALIGLLYFAL
ncbi:PepSY-associated TM helix domain-containing protein [Acinetobacter brisouii]|uniref:PepSY-associated TM helix domain-containing protein n=1 Tax=Acinetobacter brisouii TaxID=396323 RepID=UPI00124DDA05|nr:PepSY-associated TM helix domain-containing protein [Acinetobacter brisouii]